MVLQHTQDFLSDFQLGGKNSYRKESNIYFWPFTVALLTVEYNNAFLLPC